jgi:hypothetical protein
MLGVATNLTKMLPKRQRLPRECALVIKEQRILA